MASRSETITIEQTLPGERLDTFLRSQFPAVSRGTIQRLIAQGHIRVDGEIVKPTHQPRAGQHVQVYWPEPKSAVAQPEEIPLQIIHEDDDLLVVNKPPGMVVHPAAGHEDQTLVNALLFHCRGQLSGIGGVARPGIVHRLDKDTSGCLVVAKNDRAHASLGSQFAERGVHKVYHAIVCGELPRASGQIRAGIARHPSHRKRMAVSDETGREARTSYRVIDRAPHATWVEAILHTGRTHQIRVHFHHIGHPLVGDVVYGARQNKRLAELAGYHAPRQMLHAYELGFVHPGTESKVQFQAPLPADFLEALEALRIERIKLKS